MNRPQIMRSTVKSTPRSSIRTSLSWMALEGDLRGGGGTAQATSWGRNGSEMSKARTPPLKKVPTTIVSENQPPGRFSCRSEEHTSELQSRLHLVCRLLLEKKKK